MIHLAQIEIADGRLVPVLRRAVAVNGAYWLVWPDEKDDNLPLMALRSWLADQAG